MSNSLPANFHLLTEKVRALQKLVVELVDKNRELEEELDKYKEGTFFQEQKKQLMDLEALIRQLKRENKTLKEKEKLIKNKIERLAVKLEEIEL